MSYRHLPRGFGPGVFDSANSKWRAEAFGNRGHVRLRLKAEFDTMTGAAVEEEFLVPYAHRICSIEVSHRTATGAANTTALTAGYFDRYKWGSGLGDAKFFELWDFSGVIAANFHLVCGEGWEYRQDTRYRFVVNTTDGHHMHYEVILQLLDKRGRENP